MEIIKSNECLRKINDRLLIHYIKDALRFQATRRLPTRIVRLSQTPKLLLSEFGPMFKMLAY